MLIALQNGHRVLATQAASGSNYVCPGCQTPVILKRGRIKIAHFAHRTGQACSGGAPETFEHLQGKLFLWHQGGRCTRAVLEWYLPTIKQRPDVFLSPGNALEFQCSPISLTRLTERVQGYQQCAIHSEWILGRAYWQRRPEAPSVLKFVAYRRTIGYYLLFLLVHEQRFVVRYHLSWVDTG
ncbi:hypothetical protein M8332_04605 [Fructilactobacillus ixorae]|uniref:Competence protein n=1 Tax=Fructilactobacillus ixorae TaxID=1750535 RepID=A0ABY5C2B6_9LACO|nr:competence protein CoiA family protein [Fructilactobacillus ixorae]USS92917.1 hypothetical protein M8332_04605 [Fructilactobacillus ixorae]